MASPTFSQIKAHVAAIRGQLPKARTIGIHTQGPWTGEALCRDGGEEYLIRQCDSPLAMRMALRENVGENTTKVLLTSLEDKDLGDDIRLRLTKRRLFAIDSWQIVGSLFNARAVDPRLKRHAWLAEMLLDVLRADHCPPVRGGFLDVETVWSQLLHRTVGLELEVTDLATLLRWSLNDDGTSRFRNAPQTFRLAATEWLTEKVGPAAGLICRSIERLNRPDVVPIGLAASVIFHPDVSGSLERSMGKLEERYLGGETPDAVLVSRWSAAATEVVRLLKHTDQKLHRQVLTRADEITSEVQAEAHAYLSDTSPLGFVQRLARLGANLAAWLDHRDRGQLEELNQARQAIRRHDRSAHEVRRLERVDMALRLARWLSIGSEAAPRSFAEAANRQLGEHGFVDWARLSLRNGDAVRELSEAYSRLFDEVTRIRERQSREFALLLADWTAAGSKADGVVPVEQVLEQVVAPLAAHRGVLVIVIDGMSVAVCRELLAELTRDEWVALREPRIGPAIAVIPSVTEFSRTSLLCGRLQRGSSNDEKPGFAEHPALVAVSRAGSPPVVFHKAALVESTDAVLAADVREQIASPHRRVVGVVINAVDDHLLKGEQIDTRWTRDEIRVLPALLHEARLAHRLVVFVSDHGHVLDCRAESRPGEGGERWRAATSAAESNEIELAGSRVLVEGRRLIAPWSERLRYGLMKKNGYHGGATPQEMVVPIVVLSSSDDLPPGWIEAPEETPAWWDEAAPVLAAEPVEPRPKQAKPRPETLFDLSGEEEPSVTVGRAQPTPVAKPAWVAALFTSAVFAEQKRLGGRGLPSDEVLGQFLATLDVRGGKMTTVALARALEFPAIRLPGLMAKVQRLLNVDGYAVVSRDDASDTIELNRDLLLRQFELQ